MLLWGPSSRILDQYRVSKSRDSNLYDGWVLVDVIYRYSIFNLLSIDKSIPTNDHHATCPMYVFRWMVCPPKHWCMDLVCLTVKTWRCLAKQREITHLWLRQMQTKCKRNAINPLQHYGNWYIAMIWCKLNLFQYLFSTVMILFVFICPTDLERDDLWWPAFPSTHWLSYTRCWR